VFGLKLRPPSSNDYCVRLPPCRRPSVHPGNVLLYPVNRRFNENGIVNRRADFYTVLDSQTAGEPQHFRAVSLLVKIADRKLNPAGSRLRHPKTVSCQP
jgi:hypothetical protein